MALYSMVAGGTRLHHAFDRQHFVAVAGRPAAATTGTVPRAGNALIVVLVRGCGARSAVKHSPGSIVVKSRVGPRGAAARRLDSAAGRRAAARRDVQSAVSRLSARDQGAGRVAADDRTALAGTRRKPPRTYAAPIATTRNQRRCRLILPARAGFRALSAGSWRGARGDLRTPVAVIAQRAAAGAGAHKIPAHSRPIA